MLQGFLDESGDTGTEIGSTNYLVVAIVVGDGKKLGKAVTKARRSLGRRIQGVSELKASKDGERVVSKLISHATGVGFYAVVVVADKRNLMSLSDSESLYRLVCVRAVSEVLERYGSLSLVLDRRYTGRKQQKQLTEALASCVEAMAGVALAIEYELSEKEKGLQIADAVAWAVFRKFERGDDTAWGMIKGRTVVVKL